MNVWRFLPLEVNNGFWNMALDEAILKMVTEGKSPNSLRFYKDWKTLGKERFGSEFSSPPQLLRY